MKMPRLVATAAAIAVLAAGVIALPAQAQTSTDPALDAVDELVHDWSDGAITAEEALEQIETLIHEVPASERSATLAAIDDVVHHWEEGEIEAEAAMTEISAILHDGGAAHGGAGEGSTTPTPAVTGMGGLSVTGSGTPSPLAYVLLGATVLLVAGARQLSRPANG